MLSSCALLSHSHESFLQSSCKCSELMFSIKRQLRGEFLHLMHKPTLKSFHRVVSLELWRNMLCEVKALRSTTQEQVQLWEEVKVWEDILLHMWNELTNRLLQYSLLIWDSAETHLSFVCSGWSWKLRTPFIINLYTWYLNMELFNTLFVYFHPYKLVLIVIEKNVKEEAYSIIKL